MAERVGILIAGGYGEVGRRLAAELAARYPGAAIVAGRDGRKAAALTAQLGHGSRPLQLYVRDGAAIEAALADVGEVVNCVADHDHRLLRAAVEHGLAYTDVSPYLIRHTAAALRPAAEHSGARVVVGAGLAPGVTSVMARAAAEDVAGAHTVRSALLFSVGDSFGPAALDFLLAELGQPFLVMDGGREQLVRGFTDGRPVDFPAPLGRRITYRAPFADQFSYPLTLGVHTASSYLAIDPPWITGLVATLVRSGASTVARRARGRRALRRITAAIHRHYAGADSFGVIVEAQGREATASYSLIGHDQSGATAIGAALVVRALREGEVARAGVWFPEQVLARQPFFARLAARGLEVGAHPHPAPPPFLGGT